jgi:hypothetical protein
MTDKQRSDDELVEADRRAYRARMRWIGYAAAYGAVLSVLLIVAMVHGVVSQAWIDEAPLAHIGLLALPFALPLFPLMLRATRVPKAAKAPRIQRKLVEDNQRRQRIGLAIMLIAVPYNAAVQTWQTLAHPYTDPDQWLLVGLFAFLVLCCSIVLLAQPKDDDEISRAIRAAAAKIGFAVAVVALAAIYVIATIDPVWERITAPGMIAAVLMIPTLYFLIADWRAGRED